ncbi:MAG TPA: CPBP family intramembrane glutamic endopeptidase [Alphaproteobacteria bacterium]|nr:CPBP family intramembrane glutamic endopeptidase [Alphaproteobacteria bacterium]
MSFTREIAAPPRSSWFGAAVVIALVFIWAVPDVYPDFLSAWLPFRALILMLPLAVISRSNYAVHLCLLFLCLRLIKFFPHFTLFPFTYLTAFVLYAYAVLLVKELRHSVGWLRLGRFTFAVWMLILATIVISCLALILWVRFFSPDLSRYGDLIPKTSLPLALLFGFGFCTLNAAAEEIIWRGVMMESLESAFGPGLLAMLVQALSFALAHYLGGFPNGRIGVAMVFVYGIMLGIIRRKSKGIATCWLAHVAADFTIFCLILYFIRHSA